MFAEVKINNKLVKGLLDTGASVSLLGKNCRDLVEEFDVEIEKHFSSIKTAGGESYCILGKITIPVEYKNELKEITFYLCPHLQQAMYLGIDFWRSFNLASDIVGKLEVRKSSSMHNVAELSIEQAAEYFGLSKVPGDKHKLRNTAFNW